MAFFKRAYSWLAGKLPPRAKRLAYAAALHTRLNSDWILNPLIAADDEVKGSARTLRARARELARNNAWGARYLELVAENVIGDHGIQLQAHITRSTAGGPVLNAEINEEIERAWREWSRPENASVDGRRSWVDLESLAIQGVAQDGEAFIRLVPAFDNDFGFALQVLDPDQIDTEYNVAAGTDSRGRPIDEIRMGVEIDRWSRPVAYWVWNSHPAAFGVQEKARERIPASQIVHLYTAKRPGQTRGVTWLAPIMNDLKMLQGYQEAELVAARTAAAKMGFFKRDADFAGASPDSEGDVSDFTIEGDPGSFFTLPNGMGFEPWDPQHPVTAYDQFVKAIMRSVAAGLCVSYTSLSGDLTDVNFSSIRTGMLAERDHWRKLQRWLTAHLHDRVYREWLRMAILSGAVSLPTRRAADYHNIVWQPRGWPWVDPLKDAQAAALQVRLGTNSRTRLAAEQGRDFEDVLSDLAQEKAIAERFGIDLTTDTSRQGGENAGEDEAGDRALAELGLQGNGSPYRPERNGTASRNGNRLAAAGRAVE